MLIAPVVVGSWPRPTWWSLVLLLCALAAFCALYATGLWLKSRRKPRYARPALVHSALTVVLVLALVVTHPRLLAWAWLFVPGIAFSLWASARRQDRSWWNDIVLVALSGIATLVAAGLRPLPDGVIAPMVQPAPLAWPPPGWNDLDARIGALVLLVYFLGTVVHVKALIRERRDPRVRLASVCYHALALVAALGTAILCLRVAGDPGTSSGAAVGGAILLLVTAAVACWRAWYLPYRRPRSTPRTIGLIEVALSVAVCVAAVLVGGVLGG